MILSNCSLLRSVWTSEWWNNKLLFFSLGCRAMNFVKPPWSGVDQESQKLDGAGNCRRIRIKGGIHKKRSAWIQRILTNIEAIKTGNSGRYFSILNYYRLTCLNWRKLGLHAICTLPSVCLICYVSFKKMYLAASIPGKQVLVLAVESYLWVTEK